MTQLSFRSSARAVGTHGWVRAGTARFGALMPVLRVHHETQAVSAKHRVRRSGCDGCESSPSVLPLEAPASSHAAGLSGAGPLPPSRAQGTPPAPYVKPEHAQVAMTCKRQKTWKYPRARAAAECAPCSAHVVTRRPERRLSMSWARRHRRRRPCPRTAHASLLERAKTCMKRPHSGRRAGAPGRRAVRRRRMRGTWAAELSRAGPLPPSRAQGTPPAPYIKPEYAQVATTCERPKIWKISERASRRRVRPLQSDHVYQAPGSRRDDINKKAQPSAGLEPATNRLRADHSAD